MYHNSSKVYVLGDYQGSTWLTHVTIRKVDCSLIEAFTVNQRSLRAELATVFRPAMGIMSVFTHTTPRTLVRRSARQRQGLSPIQNRPKATFTESQISKLSKEQVPPSTANAGYPLLLWRRLLPPYRLVKAYGKAQEKRPYATQVSTVVLIWGCGDLLAQYFGEEDYDPWRTLRHMTIGSIISIPSYSWCGVGIRR